MGHRHVTTSVAVGSELEPVHHRQDLHGTGERSLCFSDKRHVALVGQTLQFGHYALWDSPSVSSGWPNLPRVRQSLQYEM